MPSWLALVAWTLGALLEPALSDLPATRVSVDLDVDPEHRWDHVIAANREAYAKAVRSILSNPKLSKEVSIARKVLGVDLEAKRLLPGTQWAEARGVARELSLDPADIVISGVFYDVFAAADSPLRENACTGIVAQTTSGQILHGRNLDYNFAHELANVTLALDFQRNGSTLFTAVTFGPNPTFNTAVRYGSFSITHDERNKGSILTNLFDIVVEGRPATFARIREAMETLSSYEDAVTFFSTVKLASPSYFILGGMKVGQGAVVTANRDGAADVWRLDVGAGRWYLVETNYDHYGPPGAHDDRRHPLRRAMDATGQADINSTTLWKVLSIRDVNVSAGERAPLNEHTIYSTVMQASCPETFKTVVRAPIDVKGEVLVV